MPGFEDIIGRDGTISYLKAAIQKRMVSHAWMIQGDEGSGKKMLAKAFAQALFCEKGNQEACGRCASCRRIEENNHPDVKYIPAPKPAESKKKAASEAEGDTPKAEIVRDTMSPITVGEIREQLVTDVQIRPYEGRFKVYIVCDAQRMNQEAQNALLKTLEEPPEYAVILLLTTNEAAFLSTIRSRCVLVNLPPLPDKVVSQYVMDHCQVPDYQASLCAAFASGSIGKAMKLASSESFIEIRELVLHLVTRIDRMDIPELTERVRRAAKYSLQADDMLDLMAVWYRDVLSFKATLGANNLVFQDQLPQIREAASVISYEGIESILEALKKAKIRLKANASFEVTMELLFLTIKENSV